MIDILRDKVEYYRELKGYTQEELSVECNYDKTYLGKIERGDTNPSVEAILRISDVLDIPVTNFFQEQVSTDADKFDDQMGVPESGIDDLLFDVFRNSPAIAFLTNTDGEILQLNKAASKFLKAETDNLIGQSIFELPYWSQLGVEKNTLQGLIDLGSYGRKATRRISIRYKGRDHDLQAQVSYSDPGESVERFLILQFFLIEETVDRTIAGDHFELLRR